MDSSTSVSSFKGYFLFLGVQCLAGFALNKGVTNVKSLFAEHWLWLSIFLMWLVTQAVFSYISRKQWINANRFFSFTPSQAHGFMVGCALAGLLFQKALFV